MPSRLSRYPYAIDHRSRMVKVIPITFIPAFNRPPPRRNTAMRSRHELHQSWHERQQIIPSIMLTFRPPVGNERMWPEVRPDLARVDRAVEEGRSDIDRRRPVCLEEWGRAELGRVGKGGGGAQRDTVSGGRGRGRVWGVAVAWWRSYRPRHLFLAVVVHFTVWRHACCVLRT